MKPCTWAASCHRKTHKGHRPAQWMNSDRGLEKNMPKSRSSRKSLPRHPLLRGTVCFLELPGLRYLSLCCHLLQNLRPAADTILRLLSGIHIMTRPCSSGPRIPARPSSSQPRPHPRPDSAEPRDTGEKRRSAAILLLLGQLALVLLLSWVHLRKACLPESFKLSCC